MPAATIARPEHLGAPELVDALVERIPQPAGDGASLESLMATESSLQRAHWAARGVDEATIAKLVEKGIAPMGGGALGQGSAAFMMNLPPAGTYQINDQLFAQQTERSDVPQETKTFNLGGSAIDVRIPTVGVLTKIRLVWKGSLVVTTPTGTVTSTFKFPWGLIDRFTLNANGQTGIISCSGTDLRARRQRLGRNPREQVSSVASNVGVDSTTLDPAPASIAAGTYAVTLIWDVPIVHDDYTLTGALFAQSDQNYLSWRAIPAAISDLFTVTGTATVTLNGTLFPSNTFYDIPYVDTQQGRQVIIPDLRWLHGYVSTEQPFSNTGDVRVALVRTAGQLLTLSAYIDNVGAQIDPSALDAVRFEYGSNRRPRVYQPVEHLLEKNGYDYNGRIKPGYLLLDFEIDRPDRDIVYPKGVTELALVLTVNSGTSVNANAKVHFVEETLYSGR